MSRRSAASIVVAIGALVAIAVVAIGRHSVAHSVATPRGEHVPVSKLSPKQENETNNAVSSGARISAEKPPRLPVETRFPVPAMSSHLPTIEIENEQSEESRQKFWERLRAFAVKVDLSEAEWDRLLGDLSDVASSELEAYRPALDPNTSSKDVQAGLRDAVPLNVELAHDLDERLAAWMTKHQWAVYDLRMDSGSLLSQARRLRMLGILTPKNSTAARL